MRKLFPIVIILAVLLCACARETDMSPNVPSATPGETAPGETPAPPAEPSPSPEGSPAPAATQPPAEIEQPDNLSEVIIGNEAPAAPVAYGDLTDGEKAAAAELDTVFGGNGIYEIDLESPGDKTGEIKYDFNGDGMIETLSYQLTDEEAFQELALWLCNSGVICTLTRDEYGQVYQFRSIGLCDVDRQDGLSMSVSSRSAQMVFSRLHRSTGWMRPTRSSPWRVWTRGSPVCPGTAGFIFGAAI